MIRVFPVLEFSRLVRSIMPFDDSLLLTISVTINTCVVIYCVFVRLLSHLNKKCCCERKNVFIEVSRLYIDKPSELAKIVTEQLVLWVLCLLSITAVCFSGILLYPFSGSTKVSYRCFIHIILGAFVGKYLYVIAQDCFFLRKTDLNNFRVNLIHHITTIICYNVFICYNENQLLALIGITMELNTSIIEFAKLKKKMNQCNEESYKRLSIASCAVTITFRCVVPVVFLIISMFRETPFAMSYASLTVFFISLIFFSVINVWLVLMSVQRIVRIYSSNGFHNTNLETSPERTIHPNVAFEKNNLGYMKCYANRNLTCKDDEKINTAKKEFIKNDLQSHLTQYAIRPENEFHTQTSEHLQNNLSAHAQILGDAHAVLSLHGISESPIDARGICQCTDMDNRGQCSNAIALENVSGSRERFGNEVNIGQLRNSDSSTSTASSTTVLTINTEGDVHYNNS